jgi:iron-sulfur cluster repair protein YtfE (RIC family)
MTDNNTHSFLFELQKNLEDLSSAKEQVDFFRGKSLEITDGISEVQRKYVEHLQSVKSDYESRINDLKNELTTFLVKTEDVNIQTIQKIVAKSEATIGEGIEKFETVSKKVESSNNEKIEAISGLLEQYKKIVEATDSLVKTLESVDFPHRLTVIDNNQSVNHKIVLQRIDKQDKEIKFLKSTLFFICLLIVIGMITTIFVLK